MSGATVGRRVRLSSPRTGHAFPRHTRMGVVMVAAKLLEPGPPRLFVVAVDAEEEVTEALVAFAEEHGITAAAVTAFGGFRGAVLGFFDLDEEEYVRNPVDQQTEVLSLVGDIGQDSDGTLGLHAHVVL